MEMQNKRVYSSHTNQGGDMAELQGDREKIKEAVMLCMDRRWGLKRIAQARTRIQLLPRYSRPFVGTATPLNYLQQIVKDFPGNAIPVLELLDAAERRHQAFWAKFDEENPKYAKDHKVLIENTRRMRLCYQQAYVVEAYKLGRSLTKAEQKGVAERYKSLWARWREEYLNAHPTDTYRQQLQGSAQERDSRMKALYDSVVNSPSQFGVKALSDSAEMRKLKHMEKNVRQK